MSRARSGASEGWQVGPVPGRGLRRERDGHLALPLQVVRSGQHVALASLLLTVAEAEQLHAALCYALGAEPAPADAPECREPIHYPGGRQRY
ncbi:hypothetical protein DNK48_06100 [Streptomyces malaysiensis subsp. malaysiensis]|uniref:MmyB-like transcription regulator ligand binding domain-containing protein n=1 Tax=Streptomyces autolyticus TaxID=75293 RepID=A0ABM6HNP5_9ACTN|nr:hypothetical protein BV401_40340 [Streptomyces autolyticus]QDL69045.1 hypothetical protein DNK48_06100 [Streptomyces malaysiensis]